MIEKIIPNQPKFVWTLGRRITLLVNALLCVAILTACIKERQPTIKKPSAEEVEHLKWVAEGCWTYTKEQCIHVEKRNESGYHSGYASCEMKSNYKTPFYIVDRVYTPYSLCKPNPMPDVKVKLL